jgi:hypothetical protein
MAEESIPQLSRHGLDAGMFLSGPSSDVSAIGLKFQTVLASQVCNKFLIRVRLSSAQPMIEMDHPDDNAEFIPQFEQ